MGLEKKQYTNTRLGMTFGRLLPGGGKETTPNWSGTGPWGEMGGDCGDGALGKKAFRAKKWEGKKTKKQKPPLRGGVGGDPPPPRQEKQHPKKTSD